jgi:glyoxylase-like metal-dependent hydrolase (beta-lactamase superfamily II)
LLTEPVPGVRRITAANPSPMTGDGTNGYIVGRDTVAVVDPGPDDDTHLAAWRDALAGETVSHILVTHAHLDHSALARRLAEVVRAPVLGFGRWDAGRSDVMRRLAAREDIAGGEGADRAFAPDRTIGDGDVIEGPGWRLRVMHIPGHSAGHVAFAMGDLVMTGDHVLGWTSTLISPPDGDLRQFLASSARLRAIGARAFLPGHGDVLTDPEGRIDWLVAHRHAREAQIVAALREGTATVDALVRRLYDDVPPALWPAAARNVLAHLIALVEEGRATADPSLGMTATYRAALPTEMGGRPSDPLI